MRRTILTAVSVLGLLHTPEALAGDHDVDRGVTLFVTMDGVRGESTEKGHENQFRAFDYSETWRMETSQFRQGTTGAAQTLPVRADAGPVVFSKEHGPASIDLLKALSTLRSVATATLEFYRVGADGKSVLDYRISLQKVLVVGIHDRTVEGKLVDQVQLVFESAKFEMFDPPSSAVIEPAGARASPSSASQSKSIR